MKAIADPKVFISYAWGTDEYQQKVLELCTRLYAECGVEVIVDKWSMDAGNDTFDFMERCVKDPSVNFVIMLLDKNYAEKADARQGGVGTETQIISSKVYADTAQSKFIPVVFERGEDGMVYKPAYLESRFHFDLTKENANDEFMRLVRHLYGEKPYPMPHEKGKKPDWVSQVAVITPEVAGSLHAIKYETDGTIIMSEIRKMLRSVKDSVFAVKVTDEQIEEFRVEPKKYIDYLAQFRSYRDATIKALENITHADAFTDVAADFFEDYRCAQNDDRGAHAYLIQARAALLHEIFIYTVSLLWDVDEYGKIRELLTRSYFIDGNYRNPITTNFIDVIYSGSNIGIINSAKNEVDNKNYYSGLAQLWTEHIMIGFTLDQFVFADLLIYNISVLEEALDSFYWFPLSYVYGTNNPIFARFAIKLKSKHQIERMTGIFPVKDAINENFEKMRIVKNKGRYRFSSSFDSAPLIIDYIKEDEIGKLP